MKKQSKKVLLMIITDDSESFQFPEKATGKYIAADISKLKNDKIRKMWLNLSLKELLNQRMIK